VSVTETKTKETKTKDSKMKNLNITSDSRASKIITLAIAVNVALVVLASLFT